MDLVQSVCMSFLRMRPSWREDTANWVGGDHAFVDCIFERSAQRVSRILWRSLATPFSLNATSLLECDCL